MGVIAERQLYGNNQCVDSNGNYYYCQSTWNSWGRWVALAVIIIVFFLFFFLLSCLSARRRKRQGNQPYYGTGWVGRTPFGHGQATYNPNVATQQPQQEVYGNGNNQQYNSPPAYGQQGAASGYYGDQNRGYFGGQQTEHEMQPPQAVYGSTYQPPTGPPPKKV
jgi:hypothetical protein